MSSSLLPRRIAARLLCGVAAASLCAGGALAQTDEHDEETEVEELVEIGQIDPDHVHLPGIYVQRIVVNAAPEKRIEQRTIRATEGGN